MRPGQARCGPAPRWRPGSLAGALALGRRLRRPDPGDPDGLRRRDRQPRHLTGPQRLQPRAARWRLYPRLQYPIIGSPIGLPLVESPTSAYFALQTTRPPGCSVDTAKSWNSSRPDAHEPRTGQLGNHRKAGRCGSRRRRSWIRAAPSVGLRPVRPQRGANRRDVARLWLLIAAGVLGGTLLASLAGAGDRQPGDAPDRLTDRDRPEIADTRDPSRNMPEPRGRGRGRRAGARRWSRCCARSTRPGPSGRARCNSSASSSPTPRTSCARR